jgi:FkbM family methyltransferase
MGVADTLGFILRHPLNRGGRARALGRFLRWQFATRLSRGPVAFPFVEGTRFLAERGMTGASGNYYCGLHESEDMAFVLHFLRPGDVFYDVGANIGSYTLLAAAAGAEVQAFEPSPATAARLRRNVELNGIADRVAVHECALGAQDGVVEFSQGADTTNHVLADGEDRGAADRVAIRRFDEGFRPDRPGFIKIDVEGFEEQVLAGASGALASTALRGVLVEDNGSDGRYGGSHGAPGVLLDAGFSVFRYDPQRRELAPGRVGQGTANLLFLRDAGEAGERVRGARRFKLVNGWI